MESNDITFYPRRLMARIVFGFLSFLLLYFGLTNNLVHEWQSPPLILPMADNVYWLLHILYIPQFIIRNPIAAWAFDLFLVGSTLAAFIFPKRTVFVGLSVSCFWLFQICYSTSAGNHYHHLGYLLIPIPFLFSDETKFSLMWQTVRYWAAFLLMSAGLYKLYYHGFFYENNMRNILVNFSGGPNELFHGFKLFLIDHSFLAQCFYRAACLAQLSFVTALFTKKFDLILAGLLLSFFIFDFILLNIPFLENALLLAPFLPWQKLKRRGAHLQFS